MDWLSAHAKPIGDSILYSMVGFVVLIAVVAAAASRFTVYRTLGSLE